jgi:hypothetical protein
MKQRVSFLNKEEEMIFIEWDHIKTRCCASCKMLDIGGYCAHHGKKMSEVVKINFYGDYATVDCKFKEKV